ncbi:MAG: outer membrane lipoprotein-sorting protein [Thermodesulfobacteriota bacterium]|nr:outer membrane lipoprotein-sorting protein [Thermodesulfobacteriota bacterium]
MYPPEVEREGNSCYTYLKSEKFIKPADFFHYGRKTRRVMRVPTLKNGDAAIGTEASWYDFHFYQPWDNEYRILGEDIKRGNECLVVERKSKIYPDFYLEKSVIWVEKHNFLKLHEEQFDKGGKLFKVMDWEWEQLKPSKHWVYTSWNIINLKSKGRSLIQMFNYELDSDREEREFDAIRMTEEKIWKKCEHGPPPIKKLSDFPPEPRIRWEFWNKIGIKPKMSN